MVFWPKADHLTHVARGKGATWKSFVMREGGGKSHLLSSSNWTHLFWPGWIWDRRVRSTTNWVRNASGVLMLICHVMSCVSLPRLLFHRGETDRSGESRLLLVEPNRGVKQMFEGLYEAWTKKHAMEYAKLMKQYEQMRASAVMARRTRDQSWWCPCFHAYRPKLPS